MLGWEQAQFDASVADVFGFFALQCGLEQIDCLRENRIGGRILAVGPDDAPEGVARPQASRSVVLVERFEDMPFASQSLDLVVLPHVLEFALDPHQVLREVERILRPEGRVMITGFNPISLWAARQAIPGRLLAPFMPREGVFLGQHRLRDWLRLLGFEPQGGGYGCYRPACRTQRWLDRTAALEKAGDWWWPLLGAVHFLCAVKRVRGMRLVGPAWRKAAPQATAAGAPARYDGGAGGCARVSDTCNRGSSAQD